MKYMQEIITQEFKCLSCKHRMMLVNHGVHWCEHQVHEYPYCTDCSKYDSLPEYTIITSKSDILE